MSHREELESYGMRPVARVHIKGDVFHVAITDAGIADEECCIYAFLAGDKIVRVGSSKGRLTKRLRAWSNDVTRALQGRKSPAPPKEADAWRAILKDGAAIIFARPGTVVTTPIGRMSTYLNEECELIARYNPPINRSWR
jgi:hypothetical protein